MLVDGGKMLLPILLAVFASWTPTGARVIHKRAAFYIANETMCIVDGEVFRNGDPVPTDDECERCTCRPPGFSCVLRDCDTKPGCKAVRRAGECCPDYVCGCVHNNRVYEDGEVIKDLQNACYTCRCHGSSISCTFAECLFRGDCPPEYVQGECCPRYDHCPPLSTSAAPSTVFTPDSSTPSPIIQQQEEFINLTTQHLEKFTNADITVTVEDIFHSSSSTWTTSSYDTSTLPTVTVKFTLTDGPISGISDFDITTLSSVLPFQTATYTETTRYSIPDETHGGLTTTQESSSFDYHISTPSSVGIFTQSSPNDYYASSSFPDVSSESSTINYYEESSAHTNAPTEISKNYDDASTVSTEKASLESSTIGYQVSSNTTETAFSESSTIDSNPSLLTESASTESSSIDYNVYSHPTESDSPKISTIDYDIISPSSESASSDKSPVSYEITSTSTESDFTESTSIDYDASHSYESSSPESSTNYFDQSSTKYSSEITSLDISTIDHDASHLSEGSLSENSSFDYNASSATTTSVSSEKPHVEYETSLPSTSTVDYDTFFASTESTVSESSSIVYDTSSPPTISASSVSLVIDNDETSTSSESFLDTFGYRSTSTTIPPESSSYIETHATIQTDEGFDVHDLNEETDTTLSSDDILNVASETFESEGTGLNEFTINLYNTTAHPHTISSIHNGTEEIEEFEETSTLSDYTEIKLSTTEENIKLFTDTYNQTNNLIESQSTKNANTNEFTFSTDASIEEERNITEYSSSPIALIQGETFSTNEPSKEPATESYSTVKSFNALLTTKSTEIPKIEETTQPQVSTETSNIDNESTSSISDEVIKFELLPDSVTNSTEYSDELLTNHTYESFETLGYEEGHSTFEFEISEETLDADQSNEVIDAINLTEFHSITETTSEDALHYTTQITYNTSEPLISAGTTEIDSSKIYPDVITVAIESETFSGDSLQTNDIITKDEYSEVAGGVTVTTEDFGSNLTHDVLRYTTSFPSYENITEQSSTDDAPVDFSSGSTTKLSATEVDPAATTAEIGPKIVSDISLQTNDFITKEGYSEDGEDTVIIESSDSKLNHEIIKYTTSLPNNEDETEHSNIDNTSNNFSSESTTKFLSDIFSSESTSELKSDGLALEITTELASESLSSGSTNELAFDNFSSESTTELAFDNFSSESTTELPEPVSLAELSIEDSKSLLTSSVADNIDNNETSPAYSESTLIGTIRDKILPQLINESEVNKHPIIINESGIEKYTNISHFDESTSAQFEETDEASENASSSFHEHSTTTSTKTPIIFPTELNSDDNSFNVTDFNEVNTFNNFNEQDLSENVVKSDEEISQNETRKIASELHNEVTTFSKTENPNSFETTVIPLDNVNTIILSNEDVQETQKEFSISTHDSVITSESDMTTKDSLKDLNLSKDSIIFHGNFTSISNNLKEISPTETLDDNASYAEISTNEPFNESLHDTTLGQTEDPQNTETLQPKTGTTVNDLNEKTDIVIVTLHPLKTDLSGLLTANKKRISTGESLNTDETTESNYNDVTKVTEPFYGKQTESASITTVETSTSEINDMNTPITYTNEKEVSSTTNTSGSDKGIDGISKDKIYNDTIEEGVISSTVEKANSSIVNIFSGPVMTTPGIPGEGLHIKNALFHDHKLNASTALLNHSVTESNENGSLETDQSGVNQSTDFSLSYDIADAEDLITSDELNTDLNNSTQIENFSTTETNTDDDTFSVSNATNLQYEDLNSEVNLPIGKNASDYVHNVTLISEEPINDFNFTQIDGAVKNLSPHTISNDSFAEEHNATHLNIDDYSVLDAEDDFVNETHVSEHMTGSTETFSASLESNSTSQEFSETPIESSTPEISEGFAKVENNSLTSEIYHLESTSSLDEINWSDVTEENVPSSSILPHYAEENSFNVEINTTETIENRPLELDLTEVPQITYIPARQDNDVSISDTQESGITVSNAYSTTTQGLKETSTALLEENFSASPYAYESTQFTNPTSQPTEDVALNIFSNEEEIEAYDSMNVNSTLNEEVKDGISVEETLFNSNEENQYSFETSTALKDDEEHTKEKSQSEESHFTKIPFSDERTPTEDLDIVPNAETISNKNNNTEVPETPTPAISIEPAVNTQSNSGYLTYNNHKSKETDLVTEHPGESVNANPNPVQILFGQPSNQLFPTKPVTETSKSEAHSENDGIDSVETFFTIDGNNFGIALHEYADLTSTSEQAQTTDSSTVINPKTEGQDPSFYDHEYDSEDVTSEANINFTKSIIYRADTPKYVDTTTSEDPSVTQETSYYDVSNNSSNFLSEFSQTVQDQSYSSDEKTESAVESTTASQDQFSVIGYLGELFSGINVYSSSAPTETAITENNNQPIGITTIDSERDSIETFHASDLNPEQSSNINFSIDRNNAENSFTEIDDTENSSSIISTEQEFQREPSSEIYGNITELVEEVTEIPSDKIKEHANETQDGLESSENQIIKISVSSSNFSVAEHDVNNQDDLNYTGMANNNSIENGNEIFEASLSSTLSAAKEDIDSNETTKTYETVEYIPITSENSMLSHSVSEELENISLNVGEGHITESSEIGNEITYATTVASYVLSREKNDNTSTVDISEENTSSESSLEMNEGNSSNKSDSELIDLGTKESVDVPLYTEDLNKHLEEENHSITVSVNRSNKNDTTEKNEASSNETQSLRPYSLFDVISNVFKAPGYDAEVHSSFLKEQVDYSKKEKPVTVVKRDTNQLEERQISSIYEAAIAETKNSEAEPPHGLQIKKTVSSGGNFAFQKSNQPAFASVTSSFIIVDRARDNSQSRRKIPIRNPVGDIQEIELPASFTFPPWVKFASRSTARKEEEHH